MTTIKIGDMPIAVDNRFDLFPAVAREYLTTEEPLFTVAVDDADIEEEREISRCDYEPDYYESIIAYRKIAERLPEYSAFVFHGCAVIIGGKAYIFTAKSGVGKTTHMRLWLSEFSDVEVLNGDKPTLMIRGGISYVCGTPWRGKEGYGKNDICELGGIVFLSRGEENRASTIAVTDAVSKFCEQVYLPKKSRTALVKTLRLADEVIRSVKLVSLECNMSPEAAHISRSAIED